MKKTTKPPSLTEGRMTVSQLAERCGVTRDTVSKWISHGLHGARLYVTWVGGQRFVAWDDYLAWQQTIDERRSGKPGDVLEVTIR